MKFLKVKNVPLIQILNVKDVTSRTKLSRVTIWRLENEGKFPPRIKISSKRNPKRIEALHGASLPREFERQDMAKIFNKKIKTRFPILFKRALEFQMLKASGRLR